MTNLNGLNRRGAGKRAGRRSVGRGAVERGAGGAGRSVANRSVLMSCLYVAFMLALAGVASWPIYGDWWFVVVAAASVIVGGGISLLSPVLKAPAWAYALILVVCAYVLAI